MRTTQDYELQSSYASSAIDGDGPAGAGWVMFSAVLLGLAGTWNFIDGILAISTSRVYVGHETFVFSDLNTWGWIVMILGIIQGIAALTLFTGSELARWFGISAAGLNAIGQLMFVPAYPFWAIAMFAVDLLIIYGLAVYGGKRLRQAL
ncbi:MAG: hypothetical protein ACJ747_05035 [Gaiellaceae bacterium]|jgi:hypothetical protein|nr:hypothetical protein [Acidobacteriota bacterium]